MFQSVPMRQLSILAVCAALVGCASPDPVSYAGLASASYLRPNAQDDTGRMPYRYSSNADWHRYSTMIIDPVEICRGADNQFGDMSQEDRDELAGYMRTQFTQTLGKRFTLTDRPAEATLRVKLTLTGAATNTAVLSTFTRFDIAGGLYNGVQAIRGREGMMTGSVIYAVEIYDAATNQLLDAFVTKQYPGAYNIGAGLGSLSAAKTGIDKGADALLGQLT